MFPAPRPAALLASCAVLLTIPLAACGGGSPKAASASDREQQFVKFTKCLREHGINVSTPTGANLIKVTGADPHAMEAAQKACERFRPTAPNEKMSPAERAARQDAALKFARCMRSHGVNIPDPQVGKGAIGIQSRRAGGAGGPNPSSATFQAAQNACQGLLGKNLPRLSTQSGGSASGPGGPRGGAGASFNLGTGG